MASTSQPLPYTASPARLALADLLLWARITFVWPPSAGIPSIIFPILPFRSGALDELYPSPANLYSLILQLIFTTLQALWLLSLPVSAVLGIGFPLLPPLIGAYVPVWLSWAIGFVLLNAFLTIVLLNGTNREFTSQTPLSASEIESHQSEKWIFINGVAAGSHWMQSNLDRLSLTFRRDILGIHNQTRGILFDLIECILERTFSYPTPSTRIVYAHLLNIISNPTFTRVVLIAHSQGAIEAGLALDWLYATVPASQLQKLEVYTFGSAANHFNNPIATTMADGKRVDINTPPSGSAQRDSDPDTFQRGRILRHIEHYANSGDYVAKFGVLNFRPLPASMVARSFRRMYMYMVDRVTGQAVENRYVGRLFIRQGTGHQLNGNYLDDFFPLDKALNRVVGEEGAYMNGVVDRALLKGSDIVVVKGADVRVGNVRIETEIRNGKQKGDEDEGSKVLRVGDVSRLWMYRNGMTPVDE